MTIATHAIAFPMMIRFLSLWSGRNLSCGTSARLCRRSAIMGASPELFREVDGSRIAAVSVFSSKPGDHRTSSCASITVCRQAVVDR
jgi:hypothetical protein